MSFSIRMLFALAALAAALPAAAETSACTEITTLPRTISAPGLYCLKKDLSTSITSGNAVTVSSNNVVIDCNDHAIAGTASAVSTTAHGVYSSNRTNITIRNCAIRGFYRGALMYGTGGSHLVENNAFDRNTYTGVRVDGQGNVVRRNRVMNTGGASGGAYAGIFVYGSDGTVSDNDVMGIAGKEAQATGVYAITVGNGARMSVIGNRISGIAPGTNQAGYGITTTTARTVIRDNSISGNGTIGRPINAPNTSSICRNNELSGFDAAWLSSHGGALYGCLDAGGNWF